jgi:hypothetical protein
MLAQKIESQIISFEKSGVFEAALAAKKGVSLQDFMTSHYRKRDKLLNDVKASKGSLKQQYNLDGLERNITTTLSKIEQENVRHNLFVLEQDTYIKDELHDIESQIKRIEVRYDAIDQHRLAVESKTGRYKRQRWYHVLIEYTVKGVVYVGEFFPAVWRLQGDEHV